VRSLQVRLMSSRSTRSDPAIIADVYPFLQIIRERPPQPSWWRLRHGMLGCQCSCLAPSKSKILLITFSSEKITDDQNPALSQQA
jgi:hypothetical protein